MRDVYQLRDQLREDHLWFTDLSNRTQYSVARELIEADDIATVGDLRRASRNRLLDIRNFGETSLEEWREVAAV